MSPQSSSKHGPYRKPRADIYTILLIVSLLAIIMACVFLYLEVADYPDKPPWSGAKTAWLSPDRPVVGRSVALWQAPAESGGAVSDGYFFPLPG